MKFNRTLWILQGLMAALFLFAGVAKLVLPAAQLRGPLPLPVGLLRFVGGAEVLGAVGLVLPWLLDIRPMLTPVAAGGLMVIMTGAVVVTLAAGSLAGAVLPLMVGAALAVIARGRARAEFFKRMAPAAGA